MLLLLQLPLHHRPLHMLMAAAAASGALHALQTTQVRVQERAEETAVLLPLLLLLPKALKPCCQLHQALVQLLLKAAGQVLGMAQAAGRVKPPALAAAAPLPSCQLPRTAWQLLHRPQCLMSLHPRVLCLQTPQGRLKAGYR